MTTSEAVPAVLADVAPRDLIVSIYGLYARDEGNWLSVASIVRLMADAGVDEAAVRSSVSRLKRRDTLRSVSRHGAAGYELSPSSLAVLAEGDTRIFGRQRATLSDGWLVVVFSVPESERERRHELRSRLTHLGFGTAAPGVWVAPGNLAAETRHVLERRGLADYVDMFGGEHLAFDDLRRKVAQWWDLAELAGLYGQFLQRYQPVLARWSHRAAGPREAFAAYLDVLTAWRRFPYLDPGLPLELLPRRWKGEAAGELFAGLDALLSAPAHEHALSVIRR